MLLLPMLHNFGSLLLLSVVLRTPVPTGNSVTNLSALLMIYLGVLSCLCIYYTVQHYWPLVPSERLAGT